MSGWDGWIKCEERTPSEDGIYQVVRNNNFPAHPLIRGTEYESKNLYFGDMAIWENGKWKNELGLYQEIVAWNPNKLLPVPTDLKP